MQRCLFKMFTIIYFSQIRLRFKTIFFLKVACEKYNACHILCSHGTVCWHHQKKVCTLSFLCASNQHRGALLGFFRKIIQPLLANLGGLGSVGPAGRYANNGFGKRNRGGAPGGGAPGGVARGGRTPGSGAPGGGYGNAAWMGSGERNQSDFGEEMNQSQFDESFDNFEGNGYGISQQQQPDLLSGSGGGYQGGDIDCRQM